MLLRRTPFTAIPCTGAFVVPARGESGGILSGTEMYYSFDRGRLHIVSLASFRGAIVRTTTRAMAKIARMVEPGRERGKIIGEGAGSSVG